MKGIRRLAVLLAASAAIFSTIQSPAQSAESSGKAAQAQPAEAAQSEKIRLTRNSAAYWTVTFNNPPLNIVGPTEVRQLVNSKYIE